MTATLERRSHREAFEAFYHKYAPVCAGLLRREYASMRSSGLLSASEFEEAIQCAVLEGFDDADTAWESYDPAKGRRQTWVITMVRNRFLRTAAYWVKHAGHRAELNETNAVRADLAEQVVVRHAVEQMMSSLPPLQAEILQLRCVDGLTLEDIAARKAMTVFAVKAHLQRARAAAREILGNNQPVEGVRR